jgi:hypothetical protein
MSIKTRTAIATIMRQREQGFLTDSEAYHAICDTLAGVPS